MRGSLWRRWDLHVHTPDSFYNNFKIPNEEKEYYNGNIWGKYIDELEKISEVSVLGITDYFSIDGYRKILSYKDEGRLENIDLILPNIEFRLDQVGKDGKKINYHVILSNELSPDFIEKEFLEKLQIKSYDMKSRSLCRDNIERVGKLFKEDNTEFKGNDYYVGCNHVHVNLDQIKDILAENFEGNYLLVLAERGWDTFDFFNQASQIKRSLLFDSHAVFSSNPQTVKWMLGETYENDMEFERLFRSLKPCIHGSDAHSFDKLCKPDKNRYCWIKADTTFEGLKTIVQEPKERIKIQSENPNIRKNIYTLDSVKISNSHVNNDLSIQEGSISLNENLIAITGGKGTGKTALLDLIANCFEDRCKRSQKKLEDKNSFVQRIEKDKGDLKVEISFKGDSVPNFSKKVVEDSFFENSKITYLPQGKIEDYSSNKELLNKEIEEIIFKNEKIVEKGCKQQFDDIKREINEFVKEIEEINLEIYKLELEVTPQVMKDFEFQLKIKLGELEDKKDELSEFKKSIEKGSDSKIGELKEKEERLQLKYYQLDNLKNKLVEVKEDLNSFLDNFDENIEGVNSKFDECGIDVVMPSLDCDRYFYHFDESFNLLDQEIIYVKDELKLIEEKQDQLTENETEEAKLIGDLSAINESIEDLKFTLTSLKEKKAEILNLEETRIQKYSDLLEKYLEWNNYYEKVIEIFSEGKDKILNDITFESLIHFDKNNFLNEASKIFDFRKIDSNTLKEFADNLNAILIVENNETRYKKLLKFFNKIKLVNGSLKEKSDNYEFYKWIYGNYFSLRTEAFFRERPMNKLSMGQKGTVLLKLFLAEGDYPLIIDQPEDNLDNKFIYNELVGAFKDAKKERQIIIATNNANLVVNSDAEQVIVAEFEDNNISYESGSLENPETRSKIMPILEGGKKAFREREEKYGI